MAKLLCVIYELFHLFKILWHIGKKQMAIKHAVAKFGVGLVAIPIFEEHGLQLIVKVTNADVWIYDHIFANIFRPVEKLIVISRMLSIDLQI